ADRCEFRRSEAHKIKRALVRIGNAFELRGVWAFRDRRLRAELREALGFTHNGFASAAAANKPEGPPVGRLACETSKKRSCLSPALPPALALRLPSARRRAARRRSSSIMRTARPKRRPPRQSRAPRAPRLLSCKATCLTTMTAARS